MITSVKKLAEGKFLLNDSVVISDFDAEEEGINFKVDYDETLVTEEEAGKIGEEFVMKAITAALEEEKSD